ncbi:MAG: DUF6265 family protein [Nevskiaceae bacterium]
MTRLPALLAALLAACADVPMKTGTDSIDWLTGCWRMERANGYYEEVWLTPTADGTLGVSREVRGDRTVSYEHMRLELRPGGTIAYVAKPSGQAQAEFLITTHAPGRLAFENPQHDFPQRIEYRYVDPNAITATIQGPGKDGQTKVIEYPLQRVECKD